MKKLRIYLDTSVINFVFADDAPDFMHATIEFFEDHSVLYDLYVSNIVLLEIDRTADPEHRQRLHVVLAEHDVSVLPDEHVDEVRELAERYIQRGIIPKSKIEDAMHVAYATVHEMDVLLSWNFRHLANLNKESRVLALNIEEGYWHPLRLVSPLEVMDE